MLICIYSFELYRSLCTGKYRPPSDQKKFEEGSVPRLSRLDEIKYGGRIRRLPRTAGQHNSTSISYILHRKSRPMRLSKIIRVKKLVFGAFLVFVFKWAVVPLYSAMKRFVH